MELMPTAEPLLVINEIHITYRLTEITHTVTDFEESSLIKNLAGAHRHFSMSEMSK